MELGALLPGLVVLALMAVSLLTIPLGLPGLWFMALGVGVLVLLGHATPASLGWILGIVLTTEVLEFWILRHFGRLYGGSSRAFWGAVAGGIIGVFVGLPVPILGPIFAAFLGTFLGALAVSWWETRSLSGSARVGWGMLLARAAAVGVKVGVGVGLLAWGLLRVVFGGAG